MTYAVQAEGLRKRFGAVDVLQGVGLAVPAGLTYGLLGPSGSGKTTLVRILLGLVRPDAGRVSVLGRTMPNHDILGAIGYMPQAPALYRDLTARENVAFFARIQGVSDERRVIEVLEFVRLGDRADSPLHTFSGGMVRRASLACALVHRPRLLFLDEPTVGLDPVLRAMFWGHFRDLNREGVTIILTTHMMEEAEQADRLALLRDGAFLSEGTPAEISRAAGQSDLGAAFLALAESQHEPA
jgi:ABC-2 type transport system ATP-binding protein